jgi:hypothetical protein
MGVVAAGVAAYQIAEGLQNAEMIREQGKLQKEINEMNAKYAEIDAYEAEKFGFTQAAAYKKQESQTISSQRVAMAAANVDVNSGTAAEIQAETRLTGFLNTIDIQNAGRARAAGIKREASNTRLNGAMGQAQTNIAAADAQRAGFGEAIKTGVSAYTRK